MLKNSKKGCKKLRGNNYDKNLAVAPRAPKRWLKLKKVLSSKIQ